MRQLYFSLDKTFSFENRRFLSKHQVALDCMILDDGTPPGPIVFKPEKVQEEES